MSLLLVLGFPSRKPTAHAEAAVVYVGADSHAMRDAIAASPHPEHLISRNPAGYYKRNPAAEANAAAAAAAKPKGKAKAEKGAPAE